MCSITKLKRDQNQVLPLIMRSDTSNWKVLTALIWVQVFFKTIDMIFYSLFGCPHFPGETSCFKQIPSHTHKNHATHPEASNWWIRTQPSIFSRADNINVAFDILMIYWPQRTSQNKCQIVTDKIPGTPDWEGNSHIYLIKISTGVFEGLFYLK